MRFSDDNTLNISVIAWLNCEIHQKVHIHVYLQFKGEFKENDLASTLSESPFNMFNANECFSIYVFYHLQENYYGDSYDGMEVLSSSDEEADEMETIILNRTVMTRKVQYILLFAFPLKSAIHGTIPHHKL